MLVLFVVAVTAAAANVFADRFQVLLQRANGGGSATSFVANVMVWPADRCETIVYRDGRAAERWRVVA